MEGVLERLKKGCFLVYGRAGMDLYPDPPGTAIDVATDMKVHLGGSAANIAVALKQYGHKVSLVTPVSDDAIGRFCQRQLQAYGIGTEYVFPIPGECRTSLAISESRVAHHQTVIYRNNAADFQMQDAFLDQIEWTQFTCLVITGTALSQAHSNAVALAALKKARAHGYAIILDLDYRPYSWASDKEASETLAYIANQSDIVVGNEDEFGVLSGAAQQADRYAAQLARDIKGMCLYKMGEKGAITFTPEAHFHTDIFPVQALKPVGAGDAFLGGFLASLCQGFPLPESVKRGAAAAAIVVSQAGCAPAMPNTDILENFLKSEGKP